jgi:ribonuclease P protein component
MLAREHRIVEGAEFIRVLRKGRKAGSAHFLVSSVGNTAGVTRVGFLVNKKVGNAVTRNLVRRRLQALAQEVLVDGGAGAKDVVVKAQVGAGDLSWDEVRGELLKVLRKV